MLRIIRPRGRKQRSPEGLREMGGRLADKFGQPVLLVDNAIERPFFSRMPEWFIRSWSHWHILEVFTPENSLPDESTLLDQVVLFGGGGLFALLVVVLLSIHQ